MITWLTWSSFLTQVRGGVGAALSVAYVSVSALYIFTLSPYFIGGTVTLAPLFEITPLLLTLITPTLTLDAIAEARRGNLQGASTLAIASNQARSLVALARNRALETRTVIGKVFHDLNGDGFQDLNDPMYSEPGGGWKWITGEPWVYTNWLIGEPNRGLNHMFTFINTSRVGTAVQGVAAAEAAFQNSLWYAEAQG